MSHQQTSSAHYALIEKAIRYVQENQRSQPSLSAIADAVEISESHLQRTFLQWAGVSPKQYLQYLSKEYAKSQLRQSTVFSSSLDTGLSSASRLHDLMLKTTGMTPGQYRQQGHEVAIRYGVIDTDFGAALLASTSKGICKLVFVDSQQDLKEAEQALYSEWQLSDIKRDNKAIQIQYQDLFNAIKTTAKPQNQPLGILLKGSPFQLQVWEALLKIPSGALWAYQSVAESIGKPQSTRAVASAIARNNIGVLIPCHRVIRRTGEYNHYRWGSLRKQALIAWEASQKLTNENSER